jgi:hypothetical protein
VRTQDAADKAVDLVFNELCDKLGLGSHLSGLEEDYINQTIRGIKDKVQPLMMDLWMEAVYED